MTYLLDTSVCIPFLRTGENKDRFLSLPRNEIVLCSVVLGELIYGVERLLTPNRLKERARIDGFAGLFDCLSFDDAAARHYGALRAYCDSIGKTKGRCDLMIAAIAQSRALTLITRDKGFAELPALKTELW